MKRFAQLFQRLDTATGTNAKVEALVNYFGAAPPADAAWAVHFLVGRRLKRLLPASELRRIATAAMDLPEWLVEDAYAHVGDLAETITLLLDANPIGGTAGGAPPSDRPLHRWMAERILPLKGLGEDARRNALETIWSEPQETRERFLVHKLITGGFRVGVSRGLVVRALAELTGLDKALISHRLMGHWEPTPEFFRGLLAPDDGSGERGRPYPFHLASPLPGDPDDLGPPSDWVAEWKWDGIRAQWLRRGGESHIWSRGEDLVTDRFPELLECADILPDGSVLDGEILAWGPGGEHPMDFSVLQRRIGRRTVGATIRKQAPVLFMAYDLLEWDGQDQREQPWQVRRAALERVMAAARDRAPEAPLRISSPEPFRDWEHLGELRQQARARRTEGFVIKSRTGPYHAGRVRGDWWKWKVAPWTLDTVLIYAQSGHGRRSALFTDYTLAVWDGDELVPIAKAYSGLTDEELRRMDRWIRAHTRERFGPVRSVDPEHVFEIAFEGIARSPRHKSGIALRFPRIARWRQDKPAREANTLADAHAMLAAVDQLAAGHGAQTHRAADQGETGHG